MKRPNSIIGLVIVLVVLFVLCQGSETSVDTNDIPKPTGYAETVKAVTQTDLTQADAKDLAAFYVALADRIESDKEGRIDTVERLVRSHSDAGVVAFQGRPAYKSYSNLSPVVDEAIALGAGINRDKEGYQETEITAKSRKGIAESLRAVAWACKEKSQ